MTRIYLIRHAQAQGNLLRLAQGHFDGQLTDKGRAQILALREHLAGATIDAVYSSDLSRARDTAAALSEPRGLPIHLREDLREIHLGWWEGLPWPEIGEKDPQQLHCFHHDLSRFCVEGGEPAVDALARIRSALCAIAAENEGKTVAVTSHGAVLRLLIGTLCGRALRDIDQSYLGDNTSVSLLEVEAGELRLIYHNDDTHLKERGLGRAVSGTAIFAAPTKEENQ